MTELTWPQFRPVSYHWRVTLESDSGKHALTMYAANMLELIERVTDIERAPIRAIVKIERLSE